MYWLLGSHVDVAALGYTDSNGEPLVSQEAFSFITIQHSNTL